MKLVEIYTDGACSGNPGPGGWGAYLIFGQKEKRISGYSEATTNNKMELMAVIEALKLLKEPCEINLYSDSAYVINGMTKWIHGWQKKAWKSAGNKMVKNVELWQELLSVSSMHQVHWLWVKGHAGNRGNEIADLLARSAIENHA